MRPKEKGSQDGWFQLEAIIGHKWQRDRSPLFKVKWEGYEETDNTWEPLENILSAYDHVREYLLLRDDDQRLTKYFDKYGRISKSPSIDEDKTSSVLAKNDKRSASTVYAEGSLASTKRRRKHKDYVNGPGTPHPKLPQGSWEPEVLQVCSVMADGDERLQGEIEWINNKKTSHQLKELRQKCPQALLDYYEKHL